MTVHPSSAAAWIRYCQAQPDINLMQYAEGYGLLTGPHAATWLQRGFPELLRAVRNSIPAAA